MIEATPHEPTLREAILREPALLPEVFLQPPSVLLQGPVGSGKTFSIPTFCLAGVETFVIMTEPGAAESLIDGAKFYGADMNLLHWATISPTPPGWSALEDMVKKISFNSYEEISKIKDGIGKDETRKPAMALLNSLKDFHDDRTGKSYGDYTKWDHKRALVWDGLSGLSLMSMALTIGFKPAAHQGEWGVAMNFLEQLLLKVTADRRCFFALTAHIEKETNELTGMSQVMASTLGRKLAPKIPRFFSEVVMARRTKDQGFFWATTDNSADLKNRALPVSDSLKPDFRQVVEAYRVRVKLAAPQGEKEKTAA